MMSDGHFYHVSCAASGDSGPLRAIKSAAQGSFIINSLLLPKKEISDAFITFTTSFLIQRRIT
jgi:hypothetical protein